MYTRASRWTASGLFARSTHSALLWAVGWPVAVIVAACFAWQAAVVVALALPLQILRLSFAALRRGKSPATALAYGTLTMIGKWAWFVGQMRVPAVIAPPAKPGG